MAAFALAACMGLVAAGAHGGGLLADAARAPLSTAVMPTSAASNALAASTTAPPRGSMQDDNVAVVDGATLRLDGQVVRLAGIAAPARSQDCAAQPDCGGRAALQLAALVRNRTVACQVAGADQAGHTLARCEAGGRDIGQEEVESGWAQAEQASFKPAEARARAAHLGLWAAR
jgi:endonuclease YncB( thermonuclease family)